MWIIQKIISKGDYDYAVVPEHPYALKIGHYVLVHRVILENYLGRLLDSDEIAHHINENKKDNRIENIELCLKDIHKRYHAKKGRSYVLITCAWCSEKFKREKRDLCKTKNNIYFCSKSCGAKSQHHGQKYENEVTPL